MPAFCAVLDCCDKYGHGESISFHKFPLKRRDLLDKWIDFTQRGPEWKPSKWSAICSHHFVPEDFGNVNARKTLKKTAVPRLTVAALETSAVTTLRPTISRQLGPKLNVPIEADVDVGDELAEPLLTSSYLPITNCRLCGICCRPVATFATNFEIFGMIQKCFPTLNIQQDDNLPKNMCTGCLKCLTSFSEFIDKVFETQRELQKSFRNEKTAKPPERPVKIKQEPVVKVKQEVSEGMDSFLSDELDMAIDDCDQDPCEQKFPFFSDFPMLNAQDIIDNCDIMEIVNLDDAFIDIPDDDGITAAAKEIMEQPKEFYASVHQELQMHLLMDEHNYASPMDETKDTLNMNNFYKTEKTEVRDEENEVVGGAQEILQMTTVAAPTTYSQTITTALPKLTASERNTKPIVTSVSAIAESRSQIPHENGTGKLVVTSISDLLPAAKDFQTTRTSANPPSHKPNIVVLNESIVKTASAFQLHSCTMCNLQFFSQDSLNNHINITHTLAVPMVSLPWTNFSSSSTVINSSLRFSCQSCSGIFNSIYAMLQHKQRIHPCATNIKRTFFLSCPRCEKFFVSKVAFNNHIKHICLPMCSRAQLTTRSTHFKCRHCQIALFNHWRLLRNHETNCKRRPKEPSLPLQHKCKLCDRVFSQKKSLAHHESSHRPINQWNLVCTQCNGKFDFVADLSRHYSQPNGSCKINADTDVSVVCRVCNKLIDSLQKLRSHGHLRRHSKRAASYPCPNCTKVFHTSNNLSQHRITHIQEKRHKCELCTRIFKRRGGLTQHMKGFHLKVKPHECLTCKRCYALKADMMRCRHSLLKGL